MMPYDNHQIEATLATLATISDDRLVNLVAEPAATALFDHIVSTDRRGEDTRAQDQRRPRIRPSVRLALGVGVALAGAVAAVAIVAGSPPAKAPPAMSPVVFTTTNKGYIVATITDPYATARTLNAAFRRQGLRITVSLVPVSPSVVGTFAAGHQEGGGQAAIQSVPGGRCATGGTCPIAIKIARSFSGRAAIDIGRPARTGETYAGSADPTAPGEVLHCSGLYGSTIGRILPVLRAHGLTVSWRSDTFPSAGRPASLPEPPPPASHYIRAAALESSNRIAIWTTPGRSDPAFETPGGSPQSQAALNSGCGHDAVAARFAAVHRG